MLGRFPRGKGTLLDLEFLEDGKQSLAHEGITPANFCVEQGRRVAAFGYVGSPQLVTFQHTDLHRSTLASLVQQSH